MDLDCGKLDLKSIAMRARNAEYNPKRFAAVIMRIREPRTTALIFSSGKMVCTGTLLVTPVLKTVISRSKIRRKIASRSAKIRARDSKTRFSSEIQRLQDPEYGRLGGRQIRDPSRAARSQSRSVYLLRARTLPRIGLPDDQAQTCATYFCLWKSRSYGCEATQR